MAGVGSLPSAADHHYLYQGKELENDFDLAWHDGAAYRFHARAFDAQLGHWHVHDPAYQFASPYVGMGNNPVLSIDPDGRLAWFVPIIIGAVMNVGINAAQGNIHDFWDGLGYAAVGAAAGAIGGGISAGISSAIGGTGFNAGFAAAFSGSVGLAGSGLTAATSSFFTGVAIGGGAGVGSGFISGFGNGLVSKSGFYEAIRMGAVEGAIGGITGGLIGGITSGINAVKDGRHFWSGQEQKLIASYQLQGLPTVKQIGSNDCLLGCLESIEGMQGGSRTQEEFGKILSQENTYIPSEGTNTAEGIRKAGFKLNGVTKGSNPHIVGRAMGSGNPTVVAESAAQAVGMKHAVIPVKIEVWQRGTKKVFFRTWVMDPASGRVVPRHGKGFWRNNFFFRIILGK